MGVCDITQADDRVRDITQAVDWQEAEALERMMQLIDI